MFCPGNHCHYLKFTCLPSHLLWTSKANESLYAKPEPDQYNATLVITRSSKGTLKEKFYQELWLETLQSGRRFRKLGFLFEIYQRKSLLVYSS